jgi:hypothetical protein
LRREFQRSSILTEFSLKYRSNLLKAISSREFLETRFLEILDVEENWDIESRNPKADFLLDLVE